MASQAVSQAVSQVQSKVSNINIKGPKRLISDAQYFSSTTRNETLIKQLNSNSMIQKLEAMKKIIAQLSKGKDVSDLFPVVVKNVACSSLEVKKLVYLYVIHYAEERHDEALLSIAQFQKDMTDHTKSQHVRALSLRVLSSIRVPIIVQIVLLAIRKCAGDPSPWVRKAAALAVPKIFHLAKGEKPQLEQLIDMLLGDNSPYVQGAAAYAWSVVCPEHMAVLHKHYRKLVKGLGRVDEWGQVVLLDCLLRYGRTQFLSPFEEGFAKKKTFYGGGSDTDSDDLVEYSMDDDHQMLLTNALPLLQSANHAVVVAVAALFVHLAPPVQFSSKIAKALLRIMRSSRERQYVALIVIHSLASQRPAAFKPYIKSFFVTPADPPFTQRMKIDILALLADSVNVTAVQKEFKFYIHNSAEDLVVSTVRALGRVAYYNTDVSEACMQTLTELASHPNGVVVAESVVVMRHLLQKVEAGQGKIIVRLRKLLGSIELPVARASIVWLVGEYLHVPQVALVGPDTFRTLVKDFAKEDPSVKIQIVVLGAKLLLHEFEDEKVNERVHNLFSHLLNVTKYDTSFTLRDRTRIFKHILLDDSFPELKDKARRIFTVAKKEADLSDPGADRLRFITGSLSHITNTFLHDYIALADFPKEQPDPTVRDGAALSSVESSSDSGSSSSDSDFYSSKDSSSSDDDSGSDSSDSSDSTAAKKAKKKAAKAKEAAAKKAAAAKAAAAKKKKKKKVESSSEDSDSDSEDSSASSDSSDSSGAKLVAKHKQKREGSKGHTKTAPATKSKSKQKPASSDDSDSDSSSSSSSSTAPKPKKKAEKEKATKKDEKKKNAGDDGDAQDLLQFMADEPVATQVGGATPSPERSDSPGGGQDPLASAWGFGVAEVEQSAAARAEYPAISASPTPSPQAPKPGKVDMEWFSLSAEAGAAGLVAEYAFPGTTPEYDGMTVVSVRFINNTGEPLEAVQFGEEQTGEEVTVIPFTTIAALAAGGVGTGQMEVNWSSGSDSDEEESNYTPVRFSICAGDAQYAAVCEIPVR
eukprot:TRINITY_DN20770_c0_g1_i1.p1 TRINITY_DN20770_c0_g1~~TRINITY_DN20770_c0_g1_i1.p1  ORF type:complete len:1064 (+),score=434.49 TRINITY_DN20770_c0_g1_i1:85-3192(+)